MTEEKQSEALARWLDQPPGTLPPEELDADVVEALIALRPERARAPSLTAEDILASVTRGPLADRQMATDVPVAARSVVSLEAARQARGQAAGSARDRGRWTAAAGGWGGLGVVMAIAATFLVVVLATEEDRAPLAEVLPGAPASPAAQAPSGGGGLAAGARSARGQDAVSEVASADPVASEAPRRARPSPPAASPPTPRGTSKESRAGALAVTAPRDAELDAVALADEVDEGEGSVFPLRESGAAPSADIIPEVGSYAPGAAAPDAAGAQVGSDPVEELVGASAQEKVSRKDETTGASEAPAVDPAPSPSRRAAAVPRDAGTAWRAQVDALTLQRIDDANRMADAEVRLGNASGAAALLLPVVAPPAEAGQVQAARAVQLYLRAGDVATALATARRGLALSSANTAARAGLLVAYGDALTAAGDAEGAEQAWVDAASLNAAR